MAQPVAPSTQCGLQSSTANVQASATTTATNSTAGTLIKNVKVVICQSLSTLQVVQDYAGIYILCAGA